MSDFSFCNKENFYQPNTSTAASMAIKAQAQQALLAINYPYNDCEQSLKQIPSVNKTNSSRQSIQQKQPIPTSVAIPSAAASTSNNKSNSFMQMIKKKFRFLTNSTNLSGSQSSSNNSSREEASDDSEKTNSIDFRSKQSLRQQLHEQQQQQQQQFIQPSMMHRSITDTISSSSYMNVHPNQQGGTSTLNTSVGNLSMSTLRDVETSTARNGSYMSRRLSVATTANDDVAHIFNRNSLNDCLNPPSSRRSIAVAPAVSRHDYACVGGSYRLFATPTTSLISNNLHNQPKRPSCLQLNNHFKKETSI